MQMLSDAKTFSLLNITFYAYGLTLAVAVAVCLILAAFLGRKRALPSGTVLRYGVIALPLGFILARLVFCLLSIGYFTESIAQPVKMLFFFDGGYAMTGALLGACLAVFPAAKWAKVSPGDLFDVLAAPFAAFLAIARFGETFTVNIGRGKEIGTSWMESSPFFAFDDGFSLRHSVFHYESLLAVLLLIIMLVLFFNRSIGQGAKKGDLALVCGALYGAAQVVMESMRDDLHLMWGFVRPQQIFSILLPVAAIIVFGLRIIKGRKGRAIPYTAFILSLACVVIGILQEFAIDTSENLWKEYSILGGAMALLAFIALFLWHRAKRLQAEG